MSKMLEKLGVYDLVVILLTGSIILTLSIMYIQLTDIIELPEDTQVSETFLFLVFSYFIGVVFQEIGSWICSLTIDKNNKIVCSTFQDLSNTRYHLSQDERDGIINYIKEKKQSKSISEYSAYSYCKYYVFENCKTTEIKRDLTLAGMSRSFSIFFAVLTVVSVINFFGHFSLPIVMIAITSLFFSILFYVRFIRFQKIRYINIFRMFYYSVVQFKKSR